MIDIGVDGGRRFIPAPAGNGQTLRCRGHIPAVYPRACGERPTASSTWPPPPGLSPRLRGTVQQAPYSSVKARFIPAPAGNGPAPAIPPISDPVYPRACGERFTQDERPGLPGGLSPRLRGTGTQPDCWIDGWRFIPAPAGNGVAVSSVNSLCPVYPRACGERSVTVSDASTSTGLSPRLRGTVSQRPCRPGKAAVYPRACGERSDYSVCAV